MTIMTEDGEMVVGVGGSMMLHSLYSTAKYRIKFSRLKVGAALEFLQTGECTHNKIKKTLDQLKVVKAELSELEPDAAIYDLNNRAEEAPWKGNISDTVCSCKDLFTTDDGRLLLDELISLLEYAKKNGLSVVLP